MVPKSGRVEFVDFKTELKPKDSVKILTEFMKDDKFQSPMVAQVELPNGETRLMGLNMTSYNRISKEFGRDTADWIGEKIRFMGMGDIKGPMGMVKGRIFDPIVPEIDLSKQEPF